MTIDLVVGRVYDVVNQGKTITPQRCKVQIMWIEDDAVHYVLNNEILVRQTPKTRFLEILEQ